MAIANRRVPDEACSCSASSNAAEVPSGPSSVATELRSTVAGLPGCRPAVEVLGHSYSTSSARISSSNTGPAAAKALEAPRPDSIVTIDLLSIGSSNRQDPGIAHLAVGSIEFEAPCLGRPAWDIVEAVAVGIAGAAVAAGFGGMWRPGAGLSISGSR